MSHILPNQRTARAGIRRDYSAAIETFTAETFEAAARWYFDHSETLRAVAADIGIAAESVIGAAAYASPGLNPESEPETLRWVWDTAVRLGRTPTGSELAESRPHGAAVPYGYANFVRAAECLLGERSLPSPEVKTGNYARALLEPDSDKWVAIDVWAYRTLCGDPIGTTRPLPGFRKGEYSELRRAFQAVAAEHSITGSALQAIVWVYRRGRG